MMRERLAFRELPSHLRAEVELVLGSPVVAAASQPSGFSAGSADRVITASGRRAFVKGSADERSADLHRREIAVMRSLGASAPVPTLLGSFDDGEWVALVFDDIDGRHPGAGDVDAVLHSLSSLAAADTRGRPTIAQTLGWQTAPPASGLEYLGKLARHALEAMEGDRVVHLDLRCDNVLIDAASEAIIVDWPWASRGAAWVDGLTFLLDLRRLGASVDCENVITNHPLFATASRADVTAVLAGLAIDFLTAATRTSQVPGLRGFHLSEGTAAAAWVRERVG